MRGISVPVAERGVARAVMISRTAVTALCLVAASICKNCFSATASESSQGTSAFVAAAGANIHICGGQLANPPGQAMQGEASAHTSQTSVPVCAIVRCSLSCWGILRCRLAGGRLARFHACLWSSLSAQAHHQRHHCKAIVAVFLQWRTAVKIHVNVACVA